MYYTKIKIQKWIFSLFLVLLFLPSLEAQKQNLHFRSGNWIVEQQSLFQLPPASFSVADEHYYGLVVFKEIPNESIKKELFARGVELGHYLPDYAFYTRLTQAGLDFLNAGDQGVLAVIPIQTSWKQSDRISSRNWHSECVSSDGRILAHLHLHKGADLNSLLNQMGGESSVDILTNELGADAIPIAISPSDIDALLARPEVLFLEEFDQKGEPENNKGRAMARINKIQSTNGTFYDGSGSVVGHGDDGDIGPHLDYTGRIIFNRSGASSGNHGDHVAGTILGGGIMDPDGMGMAPGASLVYSSYPSNFTLIDQDYSNYNVRITTSSYGNGCNAGYTSTTQQVDNDIIQNPKLMHVYSAGNSGTSNCSYGAGSGWGNITGGHKAGKNVIASANVQSSDVIASSSSRGPASDGRIKPDVAALGTSVYSSVAGNNYANYTGTSMACPGVSGGLAILLEAFKDVNAGQEPDGGLLKAIIQNTADDLGNSGPDFTYGYGRMNIERGVELIQNGQHLTGSISQGGLASHSIPVPSNVSQLKVMVYWTDPAASPSSSKALVNNINSFVEKSGQTWNPWVLDPTPNATALSSPAVRAVDSLNNMEQVTIDNPVQGDYIVRINGAAIPQGPQTYYVVYSYIMNGISVDFPSSGVALEPGESTSIRWSSSPTGTNFNLQYSLDGGTTWNTIGTASSTARVYNWTVPQAATGAAQIRITSGFLIGTGSDFTIIGQPSNIQFLWTCPDSTYLTWNPVSGATAYQVNTLGTRDMDSNSTSSTNAAVTRGLPFSQSVWFSVQAITPEGTLGKRSLAVERAAGIVNCSSACVLSGTIIQNSALTNSLSLVLSSPLSNPQHYVVEYGLAGFTPGTGTSFISSTSNFNLTGLASATSYDVYVQALCQNGNSTNVISGTFTTSCATFNLPYSSDMSPAAFNCWAVNDPAFVYINQNCPSAGNSELTLWGQTGLYAESADILTAGNSTLTVSFDYYDPQSSPCGENADAGEQVAIGWVSPSGVFTQMAVYDGGTAPTTPTADQFVINLNGENSIRIRMEVLSGTSNQFDNWAFDNLLVTGGGSICSPPTNLSASNITSNSATLSWTAGNTGSTQWAIEYGLAGFTAGTGTVFISTNTNNTYTIFILSPNTNYEYFVTETCSNGSQSAASQRYSFSTGVATCSAILAPFTEDFETATLGANIDFGNCWTSNNGIGNPSWRAGTSGTPSVNTGPSGDNTTGSGIYLYTEATSPAVAGDTVMLYSPTIDVSGLSSPMLEFYYHMYGQAMGILHVDVFDGTSWTRDVSTISGEQQSSNLDPFTIEQVSLAAFSGTVQLRFRGEMGPITGISTGSTFYGDMAIDDVSIVEALACLNPSSLSIASTTVNSAVVSWNASQSSFEVEYGPSGFLQGNGTVVNVSSSSVALTGLSASTSYDVYVRSDCGSNGYSVWTGPISFTTQACAPSSACTYSVSMTDSNGDGWNGAVIDLVQGGSVVASFGSSFTTGSGPISVNVNLCDGIFTEIIAASAGSYPTEVGFVITDPQGNLVFTWNSGTSFTNGLNFGSFTTNCLGTPGCSIITAPSITDFESATLGAQTDFGNCWTSGNTANNPRWFANTGTTSSLSTGPSGDNTTGSGTYMYVETSNPAAAGDTVILYSPTYDISSLNSPYLEFYYHMYGDGMGILHLDVLDGSTWIRDVVTITGEQHSSTTDPFTVSATALNGFGNTIKLRFRAEAGPITGLTSGPTFNGDMAIDDVSIIETPSCINPSNLMISAITNSSAQLNWTSSEPSFDIEYGPAGFTLGNGTISSSTSISTTLTGLSAATAYDVYLRANCGSSGNSSWVGPVSFNTLCASASIPYLQNFDNTNWPPSCWTLGGSQTVVQANSDYMEASFWSWNSGQALASTEPINISSDAQVKFNWAHLYNGIYPLDQLILQVRLANASNWDTIANLIGPSFNSPNALSSTPPPNRDSDFLTEIIYLDPATYTGQDVVFQFVFNTDYGPDVFVDDFIVESIPVCPQPIAVNITSTGSTSASINWTANASSYEIEYGLAGFTQGSGTMQSSNSNSTNLSGLIGGTTYDVYLRSLCGIQGISPWTGPISFSTDCGAFYSLPYSENFSYASLGSTLDFGNCWTTDVAAAGVFQWEGEDAEGTNENSIGTGPFYDNTSFGTPGGTYMYTEASNSGDTVNLFSPSIDLGGSSSAELRFYYHMYGVNMGTLNVHISADGGQNWNSIWSLSGQQQTSGAQAWIEAIVPVSNYNGLVQFRFEGIKGSSFEGDISIDDVSVTSSPIACLPPTNLNIGQLTHNSALMSWSAAGSENLWEVNYDLSGLGTALGNSHMVSDTSFMATGLGSALSYDFYVRAICSNSDTSAWEGPYTFLTNTVPVAAIIDSITAQNADKGVYRAYWSNVPSTGSARRFEWKAAADSTWNIKGNSNINLTNQRFNIGSAYGQLNEARVGILVNGTWEYSSTFQWIPDCADLTLSTFEATSAACVDDSTLVRVGWAGGYGVKSVLWSNGATTKRTYAQPGETLYVTVTDASACSKSDSIKASDFDATAIPLNFTLNKLSATVFEGSWSAANLAAGQSLIGYRMAYRLRNTLTWINTSLSTDTFATVDFTSSGLTSGNYEFVAFTRFQDGALASNSSFTCSEYSGYDGSGNKSEEGSSMREEEMGVRIYPNPTESLLYVTAPLDAEVSLTDSRGRLIQVQRVGNTELVFDMRNLAQGVYLIKVQTDHDVHTQTVVRN